jgi:tRNA dimethylallyltransferase
MIIVILGPTGVGKTKLSVELAKQLNGEIINADSTQVYRGLDIATAKIKEEEKEGIEHHLFDIKDINEDYTVYDYQKDARLKIKEIESKNKTPILVGGTGLYIRLLYMIINLKKKR